MTKNEVDIIKNSTIDATEAYVEARLAVADFVKTQIGVVTNAYKDSSTKKWVHTVRCNATRNTTGITYNNVLSVNNIHFQNDSVVFMIVPNAQYSNQFILGKLDNVPYDIVGGSIKIGGTEDDPNFYVDSSGNAYCKYLEANVGGSIGGFSITSDALGDALGSTNCVGMKKGDKLFAWNPSGYTYMTWQGVEQVNGHITITQGGSTMTINHANIYCDDKGSNVVWHSELSDRRYKNNINKISSENIQKFYNELEPYSFKFNEDVEDKDDLVHYGVVAQNLQDALNKAQLNSESLVKKHKTKDILLVDYQELHGLEIAGIKDLYKQIDALKKQIEAK